MKNLIFTVFLILPFVVHSQNFEKTFLAVLDEYIEHEIVDKKFDKDSVLLYAVFKKFDQNKNDFALNISMYEFIDYPIVDSLKTYHGVKMVVRYPKNMENKLSNHFKLITDTREIKEKELMILHPGTSSEEKIEIDNFPKRIESISNYVFQINKRNEIYVIGAGYNDDYYYKKFKERKLKLSKKMWFSKDI